MMNFKDFSRTLITTRDLDPDYLAMRALIDHNEMDRASIVEWIIHKVFIYDTASEIQYLFFGATLDSLKYGAERRKNKHNTAEQLTEFLGKFKLADFPREYNEALKYLSEFSGMGPWAAWKFCDLMERVADIKVDFSEVDFRKAYTFPLKGLCRVNNEDDEFVPKLSDHLTYQSFMRGAELSLGEVLDLPAPPNENRKINIQEIETCLCKYHSYLNGHYKPGKDTVHLIARLEEEGLDTTIIKTLFPSWQNQLKLS